MTALVITVTPTIGDGQVVRWHHNLNDAEQHRPFLSASRNAVMVHDVELRADTADVAFLDVFEQARNARFRLRIGADLRDLATHVRDGLRVPLRPVVPEPLVLPDIDEGRWPHAEVSA